MLCKSVLESMERGGVHFFHPDSTFCLTNLTFNWFNSTDSISLRLLDRMKQLNSECPKVPGYGNCTCASIEMSFKVQNGETSFEFAADVDCSNLGLIELPDKLPMNTLQLNVSNNKVIYNPTNKQKSALIV